MTGDPRLRVPLVILTVLIVHLTLLTRVRVAGVMPDVMLLLAIAGGISAGPARGAVVGFCSGLALDLFLETPLGLSALVFCLVGYAVGTAETGILRSAWWIPVLTALVASAAGEALFGLAGAVVGQRQMVTVHLAVVAGVVAVFNAVLAPLAVKIMAWSLAGRPTRRAFAA